VDIPKQGIIDPFFILDPNREYLFTGAWGVQRQDQCVSSMAWVVGAGSDRRPTL